MALDAEVIKEDAKRLVLDLINDFTKLFPNDCTYTRPQIERYLERKGKSNGNALQETDLTEVLKELTDKGLIKEIPDRGYASFAYNGNRN